MRHSVVDDARRGIRRAQRQGIPLSKLDPADYPDAVNALTQISIAAAASIRGMLDRSVRIKADGSPVTPADEAAEAIILNGLARLGRGFPLVSEDSTPVVKSEFFYLRHPIGGTKEFIAGRDEYTVNIALLSEGFPVLGVITAPALGVIWRGIVGRGAERLR